MDPSESKKRPAPEEASGIPQKKPMTQLDPNLPPQTGTGQICIAYHSSIEEKENPLPDCVDKMSREAPSLQYHAEQKVAANDAGLNFLEAIHTQFDSLKAEINQLKSHNVGQDSQIEELKSQNLGLESEIEKFRALRRKAIDVRQRALLTWVRDALNKVNDNRQKVIRRINKEIHSGDVRNDALALKERLLPTSTEWKAFKTLYGLTLHDFEKLDQDKCAESLQALDRAASILYDNKLASFPDEAVANQRDKIVALLLEEKYEAAENMSGTFLLSGDE